MAQSHLEAYRAAAFKTAVFLTQRQSTLLISDTYNYDTNNGYFTNWMPPNILY